MIICWDYHRSGILHSADAPLYRLMAEESPTWNDWDDSLAPTFLGLKTFPLYSFHPKVLRAESCIFHENIFHSKISKSIANEMDNLYDRRLAACSANLGLAFRAGCFTLIFQNRLCYAPIFGCADFFSITFLYIKDDRTFFVQRNIRLR